MAWYQSFMEYDSTERLLYSLAVLCTIWFVLAVVSKAPKKGWFREWGEAGFTAVWLALGIRILLVEAYSIPSESMVPTLLIKDHLVVSKLSFGWHIPKTQGRVFAFSHPKRGQIVIFVPPHEPKLSFVKRCVGLPGDTVEVRAKDVYINGQLAEVPFSYGQLTQVAPADLPGLKMHYDDYLYQRKAQLGGIDLNSSRGYMERMRTTWLGPYAMSGGTYYLEASAAFVRPYGRLLDAPKVGALDIRAKEQRDQAPPPGSPQPNWTATNGLGNRDWFGPYTLKPGEYWMMGDNRDNSSDSRYFGPVSEALLRGTPLIRYWPPSRAGMVR